MKEIIVSPKQYLTDKPCKRGHRSPRLVSNNTCMKCVTEYQKKYNKTEQGMKKAKERSRKWQRKKYGLTKEMFQLMLERQQFKCAGCHSLIDESCHVDHCHTTNRVRGLLCKACNWALGLVKDRQDILYQLAAYLELPKERPVVYLIGSLRNPEIPIIGNRLRELEFEVIDNWWAGGPIADDSWQEYSKIRGRTYKEALASREAKHVFHFDKAYLNLSDAVVLVTPSGKSAALELGYAAGNGKRGYMLMNEEPERYDVMTQFANSLVCFSLDELCQRITEDFKNELKRIS